jgi:predicted transcriptional regulator
MPIDFKLDRDLDDRINRLAKRQHQSPDAIIREALEQYLRREEKSSVEDADRHPSGKPWPHRNPVGGIITPV